MKRTYFPPVLEHILIDKQITLEMLSNGPGGTPDDPIFEGGGGTSKEEKDKPMDSPFGE